HGTVCVPGRGEPTASESAHNSETPENPLSVSLLDRPATRRSDAEPAAVQPLASSSVADPVFATKALRKFLTCVTSRESPVLIDLGPVVGSNVAFLGEQLGCKIFVEDSFADLDRHVREGKLEFFAEFLKTRFPLLPGTVHGL